MRTGFIIAISTTTTTTTVNKLKPLKLQLDYKAEIKGRGARLTEDKCDQRECVCVCEGGEQERN